MADGAQLVGAKCAILVHSRVSNERIAIAGFGAQMIRVEGNYDDSVAEASRVAATSGWTMVSDTSWPDYERISALVMQEYTVRVNEALRQLPEPPTHVLRPGRPRSGAEVRVQGPRQAYRLGGRARCCRCGASLDCLGKQRPFFTVVDPSRAACLFESARAGDIAKVNQGPFTVIAMLECYEPSLMPCAFFPASRTPL